MFSSLLQVEEHPTPKYAKECRAAEGLKEVVGDEARPVFVVEEVED